MKKCLVIDDSLVNRLATEALVEELGFTPVGFDNAKDALHVLEKENDFDVMLVDWHMPEINGIEFLKRMRKTSEGRNTVIFIYSSLEGLEGMPEALRAEADGFIYKPVSKEKLIEYFKITRLIG